MPPFHVQALLALCPTLLKFVYTSADRKLKEVNTTNVNDNEESGEDDLCCSGCYPDKRLVARFGGINPEVAREKKTKDAREGKTWG